MNYMPSTADTSPSEPDCPQVRRQYLDFEEKRAGRAVADAQIDDYLWFAQAKSYDAACVAVIGGGSTIAFGDPLQGLFGWLTWNAGQWNASRLNALLGDAEPETELDVLTIMQWPVEDEDAELVDWFVAERAVAERSISAYPAALARGDEAHGEAILARPGGLRSRSWRGGGTMRRR